ncbi:DUF2125 domain-containing protein [Rhodovulum tesquicola]|uniref:DUF2125 domain-containing protein n=1 Tax=Rhodovulum tesquicola TaxID=540254 RepID=UPI0020981191|nr:DUF2125 domain-containing protein [Rhodovulum tesquicola]MCO8146337.1 DUF2125 domain-containing protein [Rhodovulum tesquicola]
MRLILTVAILAAALWSGYWALAARGLETGIAAWVETRRAEGWAADYADVQVAGFPLRFETTLSDLALADPGTGLAWTAPAFRIEAEAHRPNRVLAIWPEVQQIATPVETIAIGALRMEGRLGFRPGPALEVMQAAYALEEVTLASSLGWEASLARGEMTAGLVEGREDTHRIGFAAEDVRLPARLVALVDRAGILPGLFEHLRIDAVLAFDAPWDRRAIEERRPQITRIELTRLDAKWGDLELSAAGVLDVDAAGLPTGMLTVRATNWRDMVAIARASGRLPGGLADRLEEALGLIARLSGRPETLDVPLRLAAGQTWLGPVPLGPVPDFTIR